MAVLVTMVVLGVLALALVAVAAAFVSAQSRPTPPTETRPAIVIDLESQMTELAIARKERRRQFLERQLTAH
jgi:hypothetical protein